MKKVVITGSTGMVGSLLLQYCLLSKDVASIVALVRKPTPIKHEKYKELIVEDFLNYDKFINEFKDTDIVFYCLGAYTGSLPAEAFRQVNVDFPLALAKSIQKTSPEATFCLLSGQGADRTEKSKMQFARDKGAIENALSDIGLKSFYTFRPGYIYPTMRRKEPNFFYTLFRWIYPIVKMLGKNLSITDQQLALTMFRVGMYGYPKEILENKDMRQLV